MTKTYLDLLNERGIRPFLTDEAFEELRKFDYKTIYAMPGEEKAFQNQGQHQIELGKITNLIGDMCWYGATEEELIRAIKHGMVVLPAEKHHLDWRQSEKDYGIDELRNKYRRFCRRPRFSEREKLVITAYTGYPLIDDSTKIAMFIEEELGRSIRMSETPAVLEIHRAFKDEFCKICRKHHVFEI